MSDVGISVQNGWVTGMCGNRVEELETRVRELEASVEGLTDELVECKVRIRELEASVDEDNGFSADEPDSEESAATPAEADTPNTEDTNEGDNREEAEAASEAETEEDSESDIIVA